MTFLRRAPLSSFTVAGCLLFWVFSPYLPGGRETIHVDALTAADVIERTTNLQGRELTDEERAGALEAFVREEILVREAFRNGWHLEDRRARRQLLLAMRGALSENIPEPSAAQLRAYYRANADRYRVPESVTVSHVFFREDPPNDILRALEAGADFRSLGERFGLGATMVRQSEHQLRGALGPTFAEAVFSLETGVWSGPFASSRGNHYVRVDARHPPELPDLASVERFVQLDWEGERRREIQERKMNRIRERYTIIERNAP